jgi:hypothetical protein
MKIKLFFILFIFITSYSFSQVGIGTTNPDTSSSLDISSTNSGILIPRISLINVSNGIAPINTPAISLLIYNSNPAIIGGNGEGYYYWNGTEWEKLTTDGNNWNTTGNFGTNPSINFIGTTDFNDLVFKTNGIESVRIKATGTVGIGISNPLQQLDVQGGNARINNTYIGDVGWGTTWAGISHYNQANSTGYGFLQSNDGNYTFLNKPNTGLGYIGFRVGNSDQAVITNAGNMGIGTTNPTEKLEVNGKIKITDGTQGNGKVLVSDANGGGTWTTTNSIKPAVTGVFAGGGGNPNSTTSVYCNTYIDLPPGKWMLFGTYLLAGSTTLATGQSVFVRTNFQLSNTVTGANPYIVSGGLISGILAGPTEFGIANGQTIINNNTVGTIRFYMWANIQKYGSIPGTFSMSGIGSSFWAENQLSAIPTN